MSEGWKCPNCGKAHGPHVDTCPEPIGIFPPVLPLSFPYPWPDTLYDPPPIWPPHTTCGGSAGLGGTRVIDAVSGRDLGPSD